jgi:superfamily II DNA/RNA helicase
VLILVPTRELAVQVATEAAKYGKYNAKSKVVCIYGGAPYPVQNRQLSQPYDILVATPGRLIDHMERGKVPFTRLEVLILDEADRMLDMGFIPAVEQIAAATPKTRQTLLFSATLKPNILRLAQKLLRDPLTLSVEPPVQEHKNIDQRFLTVDNLEHKYRLLDHLIAQREVTQAIIFTATQHQADHLADKLADAGERAAALHGGMKQSQRTRTLLLLRQQKIRLLVATDVAGRGIDISTLSHVINFDLPMQVEDYVHRIGRTGRAGASGTAFSFAAHRDLGMMRRIEKYTEQKIAPHTVPGLEARGRTERREAPRRFDAPRRFKKRIRSF